MKPTLVFFLSLLVTLTAIAGPATQLPNYQKACPFDMPTVTEPGFPDKDFPLPQYGGIPDGQTLNTAAFDKAITACSQDGGGRVVVPAGLWLTGPIVLQDNVNLHVQRGGTILFTPDRSQYSDNNRDKASPIYGSKLSNIALTGEGVIDGSGEAWRPVKKWKTTEKQWDALVKSGGVVTEASDGDVWWPSQHDIDTKDQFRPYMIKLSSCKNILVEDITLRNAPKFVFYPTGCRNITLRHANIYNEWWAQNGDGIDISACENVLIYGCNVSVGDDGICMKSSLGSREPGTVTRLKNVLIAECTVYHGHGGFVIGSNTDGGMQNIFVTNCNFIGTDIGIRVKSNTGRGGQVRDIYLENIAMARIQEAAISFNTEYLDQPAGYKPDLSKKPAAEDKVPELYGFHFKNITCRDADQAMFLQGMPESPLHDMTFENIVISANQGCIGENLRGLHFNDVTILPKEEPVFALDQAQDITIEKGQLPGHTQTFLDLKGDRSSGIKISSTPLPKRAGVIKTGADVPANALIQD